MVIFYTNSVSTKPFKQSVYNEIMRVIHTDGHKLLSPEIQEYKDLLDIKKARNNVKRISIHNQYIHKAIELSDAAIFEVSNYSFKLGLEVQFALDKKIPVLCMSDNRDLSKKVQDPLFYSAFYSSVNDIEKNVLKFLKNVEQRHLNKRMGVFLHNKHLSFLNWYVKEKDIDSNRSKVIRDALDDYMVKYPEYKLKV